MNVDSGAAGRYVLGHQARELARLDAQAAMIAGVLHTLADAIVAQGIASREQMGLDTFQQRLADALIRNRAVLLPPTLVGACGAEGLHR
jgi:hypothetical protein